MSEAKGVESGSSSITSLIKSEKVEIPISSSSLESDPNRTSTSNQRQRQLLSEQRELIHSPRYLLHYLILVLECEHLGQNDGTIIIKQLWLAQLSFGFWLLLLLL